MSRDFTRNWAPLNFWSLKRKYTPNFLQNIHKMDLSCKNTEITLWQHHIKYVCYRIFEENLYCENLLVFLSFFFFFNCILGSMDYWKLSRTHKVFKTQTLLNQSFGLFWCDHLFTIDWKYFFSFEAYGCKSILLVQFITI